MKHSRNQAFTLIELLTVVAIVIILMGLIISTAGYVQDKASRDRANAEIKALEVAMESYKADNGIYPMSATDSTGTNKLAKPYPSRPNADYSGATVELYVALSGDTNKNRKRDGTAELSNAVYFEFGTKKGMLLPSSGTGTVTGICDPWGNSYGYSTKAAFSGDYTKGYNPTFDLWSTANKNDASGVTTKWVTNW